MTDVPVTLATAGILGLFFMWLTIGVTRRRISTKVMIGDGAGQPGCEPLVIAIRAHANFVEYVPLILILMAGIEAGGAPRWLMLLLAVALILARFAHGFGMSMPAPNPLRAGGAMVTWLVLIAASITALVIAF